MQVKARIIEGGAIIDNDDTNAEEYSKTLGKLMAGEYRTFVKMIVETINPPNGASVLEIGPGPGWITLWLAQARPDVSIEGLEPSPDMRRQATRTMIDKGVIDRVQFIPGFVEHMDDLEAASYDLIISNGSLHHWEDPVQGFREIARVLKPDGKIFIQDGRRDLGLGALFIVDVIGRLTAGRTWKYWKRSINAGYTPAEVQTMLAQVPASWIVHSNFMELWISSE